MLANSELQLLWDLGRKDFPQFRGDAHGNTLGAQREHHHVLVDTQALHLGWDAECRCLRLRARAAFGERLPEVLRNRIQLQIAR